MVQAARTEASDDSIRIMVASDHGLFRTGLARSLADQDGIEVVAQVSDGRMALREAASRRIDVVLLDLRMSDPGPEDTTGQIVGGVSGARVVALSVAARARDVLGALSAGASGCVTNDSPIEDVVAAIRAAARGVGWLSPGAVEVLHERLRGDHTRAASIHGAGADLPLDLGASVPRAVADLTQREIEVLRLLARGLENHEIASLLAISPSTARHHTSRVLAKLALPNRVQAAVFAVRHDLV